jgi:putative flippase GtrA
MLLHDPSLMRYPLASAAALAFDGGAFLSLIALGVDPVLATLAAYGSGVAVHWLLSTRYVFKQSAKLTGAARRLAKLLFVLTAIIGLAVSAAVVSWSISLGAGPVTAKAIAVIASYLVTYVSRRQFVFPA